MPTDLHSPGPRQNSSTPFYEKPIAILTRNHSRQPTKPKSTHTSDPFLADFLGPSFDPVEYINSALPPVQQASGTGETQAVSLTELSSRAQTLTSQLNAHTTRLSDVLTNLTDEILRSGSRLAYEVELLRGELLSLTETLTEGLQEDIKMFVPGGLQEEADGKIGPAGDLGTQPRRPSTTVPSTSENAATTTAMVVEGDLKDEPPYIKELHALTVAKSRLDQVIKTFGDAMDFVFPPSEMSVSSSFLSVSAPGPGSAHQSSEETGQQVLKRLRLEVSQLLASPDDPVGGIERAAQRVEELKNLATVWKGTAEEKGRTRFVEGLARMVEDRHRDLLKEMEQEGRRDGRLETARGGGTEESKSQAAGYGLMSHLQRIRAGL